MPDLNCLPVYIDAAPACIDELLPPRRVEPNPASCVHTPCPEGYNAWHEWASLASKTHSQVTCPCCGKWSIWLPKAEAAPINAAYRAEIAQVVRSERECHRAMERARRAYWKRRKAVARG